MKAVSLILALSACAFAQDARFYRLDFNVKELDDTKVVSTKKYSTTIGVFADTKYNRNAQIRAGSRVPYQVQPNSTQFADVGVNIDCQDAREVNGQFVVHVNAELSSVPAQEGPITTFPLIRQNRWAALATVDVGKPTLLFSSDDLNSKRKMQLELTATLIK